MLSAYELHCGKLQMIEYPKGRLRMWHEGGVYHVRLFVEWEKETRWEAFPTLKEAQKKFREFNKLYERESLKGYSE